MVSFECDYNNGMAPNILSRLAEENSKAQPGYGYDEYTLSAVEKIKKAVGRSDVEVSLIGGGTETNQLVIGTLLSRCEGVIAASSGHIAVHESGAIEYTGHKVITIDSYNGKIDAGKLEKVMEEYMDSEPKEALVTPRMVYISEPTEMGTVYKKSEIEDIRKVCDKYSLLLYLDGARLAYALASPVCDLTLCDIAALTDTFYIGGTKCGAIIGEALVMRSGVAPENFKQMKKQSGALLAKGRLLGIQFDTLFENDYYLSLGRTGMEKAGMLKEVMLENGYREAWESPSNQLFFIMDNDDIAALRESVVFERWSRYDEKSSVVRFCTSWSTTDEDIKALEDALRKIEGKRASL